MFCVIPAPAGSTSWNGGPPGRRPLPGSLRLVAPRHGNRDRTMTTSTDHQHARYRRRSRSAAPLTDDGTTYSHLRRCAVRGSRRHFDETAGGAPRSAAWPPTSQTRIYNRSRLSAGSISCESPANHSRAGDTGPERAWPTWPEAVGFLDTVLCYTGRCHPGGRATDRHHDGRDASRAAQQPGQVAADGGAGWGGVILPTGSTSGAWRGR